VGAGGVLLEAEGVQVHAHQGLSGGAAARARVSRDGAQPVSQWPRARVQEYYVVDVLLK
jgi:hypothetical protein